MFVEQKKMIILVLVLVVVLVLAGVGYRLLAPQAGLSGTLGGTQRASGSSASSATAQPAPDFTVYDADGGEVTLASLMEAGKPAVLNFWASTCPPCRSEMPDFEAAFQKYGSEVQFIMVDAVGSMNGETRQAGSGLSHHLLSSRRRHHCSVRRGHAGCRSPGKGHWHDFAR